jgi:crotonobetainyl-CoA:carnitine CoA-transferase CaiB-like acyl-CoA transferase
MSLPERQPDTAGPLAGLLVVELGHFVAAPFAARLLADLGADVIKVEPPGGDPVRGWGMERNGNSIWWSVQGRNKRVITANLKSDAGRGVVLDLLRQSDVLIENFRPGQLARLGLSDEVLRAANPRLVIAHISGFGQTGPDRDRAGFGVIGEAIGGLRHLTNHALGTHDFPPVRVGVSIGDSITGMYAVIGILAALWQRDRAGGTGRGQPVDAALTESVLSLMEAMVPEYSLTGQIRQPVGARIPTAAPTSAYRSADGRWVIIAANSDPLFARFCALMGRPELARDPRFLDNRARLTNVEALDAIIEAWSRTQQAATLEKLLAEADIPSCRIFTVAEIAADRQFLVRGMVQEVEDPLVGPLLHPGIVPHMPEAPGQVRWTGRKVGADTEAVLADLLGLTAEQIAELRATEAI